MQENFQFAGDPIKLQKQLTDILRIVEKEVRKLEAFLQRKNRHLLKQSNKIVYF